MNHERGCVIYWITVTKLLVVVIEEKSVKSEILKNLQEIID